MTELLQLALEVQVVLDDAVVHDDDLAGAVLVRMGVLFGGPAVRGPARVPDAVNPFERLGVDGLLEIHELARASAALDLPVAHDRDARGVVAAIFEAPQAVDQDGHDLLPAEITDDSAHTFLLSTFYFLLSTFHFLLPLHPAFDVPLLAAAHREGARRNVLADRRAAADVGALADRDRRDEL